MSNAFRFPALLPAGALLALSSVLGGCAATQHTNEPDPFASVRADQLLRNHQFDAAIKQYLASLSQNGGDPQEEAALRHRLSQAYWGRQGRIDGAQATEESKKEDRTAAIESAKTALELLDSVGQTSRGSRKGPVVRTLGAYLLDEGKLNDTISLYAEFVDSESESTEEHIQTLLELGNAYYARSQGGTGQAENALPAAEDLVSAQKRLEEALDLSQHTDQCPPSVLAGIDHSLGLVCQEQLQFALAAKYFADAEKICREKDLTDSHAEVLQSLTLSLIESGRYDEARDRCKQLEQLPQASVEPRTMTALGVVYLKLGRPSDALTEFDLARNQCLQDDQCHQDRDFLAELACDTASASQELGAFDEAEKTLRNAQAELGDGLDPRMQAVLQANLARIYLTLERLDAAQTALEAAKAAFERIRGPRHPDTLLVELDLASLARTRGHLIEARKRYEGAIRALIARLGKDDLIVASSRLDLASVYQDQGLCAGSLELAKQAQHGLESLLGPDHPRAVAAFLRMVLIAAECRKEGEDDKAVQNLLEEAARRFKKLQETLGTNNVEVLRALVYFADATAQTPAAVATALERYREAEKGFLELYGSGALSVAALRLKQARLLQRMDRHDEAISTCEKALRLIDHSLQQHPIRAELLGALGDSLAAKGEIKRAAPLWREALQILTVTYGSDHPRVQHFKEERRVKQNPQEQEKAP